ncbi:AAA family ATPase [Rhizobium tumorigenes]|uniref:AAA family ATPase n=1 Tax=Rhizobium tumorigenes TaxID=2041385 RepID=UPI00241C29B6|nr:AAA family ATPase [Rhizobium tumorigenes]WFR99560.1 AAA family ATPase [Rhizobium tumorigenes]
MKNLARKREGFGLPEYIASCAIQAALRHYGRSRFFAVALVVPTGQDADTYYRAAEAFLNPNVTAYGRLSRLPILVDEKNAGKSTPDGLDALSKDRALIVATDRNFIAGDYAAAVDEIIELRQPTSRDVKGLVLWLYDTEIDDETAGLFLQERPRRLNAIMRPGRSIHRVIKALRQKAPALKPNMNSDADIELRLENLAGYGEAKDWGLRLAHDIKDWKAGLIGWHDVDRGLLLSGQPGTGKTIFAGALAATCGMEIVYASAARWQSRGHLGDFLRAMIKTFDEARGAVPCILFIDEVDAFGSRDGDHGYHENYIRQAVNGFLECLDGTDARDGVVVVAACNNPRGLDPAIIRPGRLDHHIQIPLPDADARARILHMHLRGDLPGEDFLEFSGETEGLSGADLAKIIREARRIARTERRGITADDIRAVLPKKLHITPEMQRVTAVHELGHAIVGICLDVMDLQSVTIEEYAPAGRTVYAVGGARFLTSHGSRWTEQRYLDHIAMVLAGIVAEQLFTGAHDHGVGGSVGSDLDVATNTALRMLAHYGMGGNLVSWGGYTEPAIETARYNPLLMAKADAIMRDQFERAKAIVSENRQAILNLREQLLERKQLSGDEVRAALELQSNPSAS